MKLACSVFIEFFQIYHADIVSKCDDLYYYEQSEV